MDWINTIVQGVLIGGLYALFAAGLSLIFGVMRLVNIAHGDFIVGAAYLAFVVIQMTGMHPLLSLVIVVPAMAGIGYVMRGGYDLPPIMFDEQEIEALVLGARIVETWADPKLAEAAGNVIAKVEAVIPERLRRHMAETALLAPANHYREPIEIDAIALRRAVRERRKVSFDYLDAEAQPTARAVWPLRRRSRLPYRRPAWRLAGFRPSPSEAPREGSTSRSHWAQPRQSGPRRSPDRSGRRSS